MNPDLTVILILLACVAAAACVIAGVLILITTLPKESDEIEDRLTVEEIDYLHDPKNHL